MSLHRSSDAAAQRRETVVGGSDETTQPVLIPPLTAAPAADTNVQLAVAESAAHIAAVVAGAECPAVLGIRRSGRAACSCCGEAPCVDAHHA
jgi:hypothetical protein